MANISIKCLDEMFVTFSDLNKVWKMDKRYPERALQKFITLNRDSLNFIDVKASIKESNNTLGLILQSGRYVGSSALRSPANGKHYQDIDVTSRFGENVADVANMLKEIIEPEYIDQQLLSDNEIAAPLYLICTNYFMAYKKAMQTIWNKFDVIRKYENIPSSSTNWKEYIEHSYDPKNVLKFNNRKSIQSKAHKEWFELSYVAKKAINIFSSPQTPISIKCKMKDLVNNINNYINHHHIEYTDRSFTVNSFDPVEIKSLKILANKLINQTNNNRLAWRIDSAVLFERYTQYMMEKVALQVGASIVSNSRFKISGDKPSWCLRYLEPDILLRKDERLFAIDAKYKAHMFNLGNRSDSLKESFRLDLHQILAYSSFDKSEVKLSMILYPCQEYRKVELNCGSGLSTSENKVILVGLSFDTKNISTTIDNIVNLFQNVI